MDKNVSIAFAVTNNPGSNSNTSPSLHGEQIDFGKFVSPSNHLFGVVLQFRLFLRKIIRFVGKSSEIVCLSLSV